MNFRLLRLAGAVGVAALVASSCGSTVASAVHTNAITVDGTSISRRDLQHDVNALASNAKFVALDKQVAAQGSAASTLFDKQGQPTRVLTTSWLNRLVNQIVVDREFKRRHLKVTAADLSEGEKQFAQLFATQSAGGADLVAKFPKWFREQERQREARLVALTRALNAAKPITEAAMRAFYVQNVGSLCPSGFNVSHILVKTLPEAQAIEAQLAAGGVFSTIAQAKSTDTSSGAQGGALGCFKTGQFVAAFEQAAQKAVLNVPTAPVKTEFGYHIILKTKYVPPTFESVKAEIAQQLAGQANLLAKFVGARLKKATVRVDPLYGTWNKKNSKVEAPKVPAVRNSRNATTTPTS
jgi:hypothetical protein